MISHLAGGVLGGIRWGVMVAPNGSAKRPSSVKVDAAYSYMTRQTCMQYSRFREATISKT
jgi:hypothetical protein